MSSVFVRVYVSQPFVRVFPRGIQGPSGTASSGDAEAGTVFTSNGPGNAPSWEEPTGGVGGTPSDTVVSETTHGQAAAAGDSDEFARGDHTHGTPAMPTAVQVGADPAGTAAAAITAHEAASDPHPGYTTTAEATALASSAQTAAEATAAAALAAHLPFATSGHTGTGGGATSFPSFGTTGAAVLSTASAFLALIASAALTAINTLTPAADRLPYYTSASAAALATFTAAARTLLALTAASGDLLYASATNTWSTLAANSTATRKFLRQVSSGAPAWDTLAAGDLPAATTSAAGAVELATDGETGSVVPTGDDRRLQKHTPLHFVGSNSGTAPLWTNQPLAFSEFIVSVNQRRLFDATGYTEARLVSWNTVVGATGSKIALEYSTDGGSTWQFADGTATGAVGSATPQLLLDAGTGERTSAWATLTANARAAALWRISGDGGNGTADPAWTHLGAEFR